MKIKYFIQGIAFLAMLIILLGSMFSSFVFFSADAATQQELEAQRKQLEQQERDLKNRLSQYEKDAEKQREYAETLGQQIDTTRKLLDSLADEIALLNRQAADKNKEIDELAARIADKQEEIADRFEQLRMRVRTIAKGGHLNELQMLFDTGEFTDFLLRGKLVSRIADNDRRIMEEMEEELGNIEEDKARLEVIRRELAAKKDEADNLQKQAEQRKKNLDAMYATAKAVQKKLEDAAKYTQDEINKIKREQAGLDDQIKKLLASVAVTGNYTAGTMAWPVPAVKNISSPYGPRMGTTHRGIDIANGTVPIYGKNIVAAADGVVIYTNTSGYGGGYGSYIIVDHGLDSRERRITTLYAHCSKVSVTVGQKVVKGETVLGLVGSTGNSTGPHLHFEVRIDGEAVDPIKNGYVSKNS